MTADRRWSPPSAASLVAALTLVAAAVLAHCTTKNGKDSTSPFPSVSASPAPPTPASTSTFTSTSTSASTSTSTPPSASVPASASAPTPAPTQRRAFTIAVLGDSLSDYASHGGAYLRFIQKRCPETRIDNFAKGGFMVNQMRRRFFADVLPKAGPYTHLIVFGGVNDLYSDLTAGRTPKKISADLTSIYAAARERSMRIVAINVAPWGGFRRYYNPSRAAATRELNDWIRAQLEAHAVDHLVDAYALLSCGDPERLCPRYEVSFRDGLHLGPEGQERLGEALYAQVFRDCR